MRTRYVAQALMGLKWPSQIASLPLRRAVQSGDFSAISLICTTADNERSLGSLVVLVLALPRRITVEGVSRNRSSCRRRQADEACGRPSDSQSLRISKLLNRVSLTCICCFRDALAKHRSEERRVGKESRS